MRTFRLGSTLLFLGAALVLACPSTEDPEAPEPPPAATRKRAVPPAPPAPTAAEAREQAQQIFTMRCVTCHGPRGAGDGPGSTALTPPPRNFQDPEWQTSVSDEHLEKIILYGGTAVGRSVAMPPNPDLNAKPEVVASLVTLIRELRAE